MLGDVRMRWFARNRPTQLGSYNPKSCTLATPGTHIHTRRKPDWLRHEVLRLKAHKSRAGCRAVAHTFIRLHPDASVGKTFVADLIASHQHEIAELRRQIR